MCSYLRSYVLKKFLVLSCTERYLERSIPEDMNVKYIKFLRKLKEVFQKRKKHYPIHTIIMSLRADDEQNLTYFSAKEIS